MSLILASGSPRRRELMAYITKDFEVCVSGAEENVPAGLSPAETVEALAKLKGASVAALRPNDTVIGADTVVCIDGGLLGKPHTPEEAFDMLRLLSERTIPFLNLALSFLTVPVFYLVGKHRKAL